ncbi:MAG: nitrilase-related carbon-nitrogen hydrolase [Pseudomonadota bacterium]
MTALTRRQVFNRTAAALTTSILGGCAAAAEDAPRYTALALQTKCDAVNQDKTRDDARARMMASLARIDGQIGVSKAFLKTFNGTATRLVTLPEYFMTGFPLGESLPAWRDKAAIDPEGEEYARLAAMAEKHDIFLAGNAYETDANFPELYFQTNFLISPAGKTVLRYRRLISMYTPSPYDVWDKYLDLYGLDGVFPVAQTEIGAIAGIASEEILYPEVARCLAMRGAEIFFHPTSEVAAPKLTQKDIAKRARAIENMAYVVSANTAEITGTPLPAASTDAMSKVVHYDGTVLASAESGESMTANALIDLPALRAYRQRTGMSNFLARQPFQAYAESYADTVHAVPNGALRNGEVAPPSRGDIVARQRQVIEKLMADGVVR